ncbi:MAG: hypothetical protein WC998_00525 [Candidatus Paceibacterota bacterium]|jgi:hypothetical protein
MEEATNASGTWEFRNRESGSSEYGWGFPGVDTSGKDAPKDDYQTGGIYDNLQYDTGQEDQPKEKKQKDRVFTAMQNAVLGAVSAFTQSIISGDIDSAITAAFTSLTYGIADAVTQMVTESAGGGFGANILGMLAGGGVGFLLSKLFGLQGSKKIEQDEPILAEITNWPEFFKSYALPSSAYFQPTGINPTGTVIQHNHNNINVASGPKTASLVQTALTEAAYLKQLQRGLG